MTIKLIGTTVAAQQLARLYQHKYMPFFASCNYLEELKFCTKIELDIITSVMDRLKF